MIKELLEGKNPREVLVHETKTKVTSDGLDVPFDVLGGGLSVALVPRADKEKMVLRYNFYATTNPLFEKALSKDVDESAEIKKVANEMKAEFSKAVKDFERKLLQVAKKAGFSKR